MRLPSGFLCALVYAVLAAVLFVGCDDAQAPGRKVEVTGEQLLQGRLASAQHELAAEKRATLTEHEAAVAADRRVAEAKGILAQAQDEAKDAHAREAKAIEEARLAPVRSTITLLEIVCLIASGLGVVAAVVIAYLKIPWGWKIPAGFAAGFAVLFGLLVVLSQLLTHLAALVWGLAAAAALALIVWAFWSGLWDRIRQWKVTHELRRVGDEALAQLEARGHGEVAQSIKNGAMGRQLDEGIQHLVQKTIAFSKQREKRLQAGG